MRAVVARVAIGGIVERGNPSLPHQGLERRLALPEQGADEHDPARQRPHLAHPRKPADPAPPRQSHHQRLRLIVGMMRRRHRA